MTRSARRPERPREPGGTGAAVAEILARNPAALASGAAFAVTLGFVSANALWFQPHVHPQALFSTRTASGEPAAPAQAPRAVRPAPEPDPVLQSVQASLEELGFEVGAVDGLDGPATRAAVAEFQLLSGLEPTGRIDESLLIALDEARGGAAPAAPSPEHTGEIGEPAETPEGAPDLRKLQAGLRAFGNAEVEVDGIMGAKTRSGILAFQAMFGLPETGEPDPAVFAKMREIGLTD